jgi:tRNA(Ile)-lysidine synthase
MLVYERVTSFLTGHRLLPPGGTVVVGVSGGADSLCLFDALHALGFQLTVAHLDHRLRPGSWRDAEFVLRVAARYGVPAVAERLPAGALPIPGRTLEEGARILRYRFLRRVALERGAAFVAVGHTADDQAETILMHFLRGAGVHGLRGMVPAAPLLDEAGEGGDTDIRLVRPLLGLDRQDTEAHCHEVGLKPRRDRTNADTTYFRNRLRHELLPHLATYNPGIRDGLLRLGNLMRAEADLIDTFVAARIPGVLFERAAGMWALNRAALLEEPRALQMALVREAARRVAPEARDFGQEAVARALEWVGDPHVGKRLALPGRRELVDEGTLVVFQRTHALPSYPEYPQLLTDDRYDLRVPFEFGLAGGWTLKGKILSAKDVGVGPRASTEAVLDADGMQAEIVIRAVGPGDRLQLDHHGGTGKVADLFINRHIPRGARRRWPLVVAGGSIVWVTGLRVSASGRVGARTRRVLALTLVPPTQEEADEGALQRMDRRL